ncbi:MAG: DUF2490 domain-containing protein [Cytophagales bacterium]|nr:DUF2490 domain-containing protein [Cytophagales bacterium]
MESTLKKVYHNLDKLNYIKVYKKSVVIRTTILVLFCGPLIPLKAQDETIDNQLWTDYSLSYDKSNILLLGGDMGFRGSVSNYDWNQFYIRPAITFRSKYALSLTGAIAYFHTNNKSGPNINEFRAHQQLKLKWPDFGMIELFYRIRLEQRFFQYSDEIENEFNNRLRLLFGIESRDFNWIGPRSPIYFAATIEGFKTLGKENSAETFINQFRLDFAFGHRISSKFRYEIHYIAQQSKLFRRDGNEAHQNILRVRFLHSVFNRQE